MRLKDIEKLHARTKPATIDRKLVEMVRQLHMRVQALEARRDEDIAERER